MSRTRDLSKLLNDNVLINTLEEVAKQEDLEDIETDPLPDDLMTMGG